MALIGGGAKLLSVVMLTAPIGVGTAFYYPARGGLVAQLAAKDQLARANGAFVASAGPKWAIGIDGLTYAVSALCLALVRDPANPMPPGFPALC
ncbi:MFS transporter [Sphingomonas nostoxanthinifaciens]|uniref:hypothetical protein n=1 Tax=Sphingomonas nostoxanthinifaciens TaxID=2872652 RepID=UPI001CC1F7F5|nr:hypothetical protein [Sphingomonas nostoxanthinifaciens]UAK25493.1 hypothetical protein K8P63_04805 [Sphingomonas nostoxanthinifaciens]